MPPRKVATRGIVAVTLLMGCGRVRTTTSLSATWNESPWNEEVAESTTRNNRVPLQPDDNDDDTSRDGSVPRMTDQDFFLHEEHQDWKQLGSASSSNEGTLGMPAPFKDDRTTDLFVGQSPLSPSSQCWTWAVSFLVPTDNNKKNHKIRHGYPSDPEQLCHAMTPAHQKTLALHIAACHLQDLNRDLFEPQGRCSHAERPTNNGKESVHDPSNRPPNDILQCLSELTDAGMLAYTQYISHVQILCLRLTQESMVAHQESMQQELWKQQVESSRSLSRQLFEMTQAARQSQDELEHWFATVLPQQVHSQVWQTLHEELSLWSTGPLQVWMQSLQNNMTNRLTKVVDTHVTDSQTSMTNWWKEWQQTATIHQAQWWNATHETYVSQMQREWQQHGQAMEGIWNQLQDVQASASGVHRVLVSGWSRLGHWLWKTLGLSVLIRPWYLVLEGLVWYWLTTHWSTRRRHCQRRRDEDKPRSLFRSAVWIGWLGALVEVGLTVLMKEETRGDDSASLLLDLELDDGVRVSFGRWKFRGLTLVLQGLISIVAWWWWKRQTTLQQPSQDNQDSGQSTMAKTQGADCPNPNPLFYPTSYGWYGPPLPPHAYTSTSSPPQPPVFLGRSQRTTYYPPFVSPLPRDATTNTLTHRLESNQQPPHVTVNSPWTFPDGSRAGATWTYPPPNYNTYNAMPPPVSSSGVVSPHNHSEFRQEDDASSTAAETGTTTRPPPLVARSKKRPWSSSSVPLEDEGREMKKCRPAEPMQENDKNEVPGSSLS